MKFGWTRSACRIALLFVIALLLAACASGSKQSGPAADKPPLAADLELGAAVEQLVKEHQAVDEAVAVALDRHISVALKVSGFQRLRLKQIRREVNEMIQSEIPSEYTVHITTDKRLIRDLKNIAKNIKENNGIAQPKIRDEFEKINKDMHG